MHILLPAIAGLLVSTLGAQTPAGFTNLFNGKDLSGWRGRPGGGGVFSSYTEAKFTPEERKAQQTECNASLDCNCRVDAQNNDLLSNYRGVLLATEKPYG